MHDIQTYLNTFNHFYIGAYRSIIILPLKCLSLIPRNKQEKCYKYPYTQLYVYPSDILIMSQDFEAF